MTEEERKIRRSEIRRRSRERHKGAIARYNRKYQKERYEEDSNKAKNQSREWARNNRERFRENRLKRLYGITQVQFDQMKTAQNNSCAICGDPFKVVQVVTEAMCTVVKEKRQDYKREHCYIDHDHNTGKVRQLLCGECNTGLGKFKESASLLRKAADYLDKWSKPV